MDETVAKVLKKLAELKKMEAEIHQFLDLYKKLTGEKVDRDVETIAASSPQKSTETRQKSDTKRQRRNNPRKIADMAEKMILKAGRPMQRGELVEAIEAAGLEIFSEDKPRYIGTVLWRESDRFENLEGKGYRVKSIPGDMKEQDYDPLLSFLEEQANNINKPD